MVDNFKLIKPLLEFRSDNDFYFLQVIQRKKDYKKGKVNGTNNNSRLIKAYYIKSIEHLEFVGPEIKELCKVFNARAGINLNRRSFEKIALQHLKKVTDQIINKDFNKAYKAYSSVTGAYSQESDKKWILDIDGDVNDRWISQVILYIERECRPIGDKFITIIPSKNGKHIIVKPFDLSKFKLQYPDIEIHKNNPTNCFIP